MAESLTERINRIKHETGADDEVFERPVEEKDGWHFGERVRIVEDDENRALCAGDEGYLIIGEVGAPQYGNTRAAMHVLIDGYDLSDEITSDDIEAVH